MEKTMEQQIAHRFCELVRGQLDAERLQLVVQKTERLIRSQKRDVDEAYVIDLSPLAAEVDTVQLMERAMRDCGTPAPADVEAENDRGGDTPEFALACELFHGAFAVAVDEQFAA
jgi:hypothetical protein